MSRYTVLADGAVDGVVQRVIDSACDMVVALMGRDLKAIVLVGAFGRGEGGAALVEDQWLLQNDLDIVVVPKLCSVGAKRRYGKKLSEIGATVQRHGSGLKKVDLEILSLWSAAVSPRTVGYYEILNGHMVLWGRINLRRYLGNHSPELLSPYEGANYLRNRAAGLLIAALLTRESQNDVDNELQKLVVIEVYKACIAMGDSFLLLTKNYHYSYERRLQFAKSSGVFDALPTHFGKEIAFLYSWGVREKLEPKSQFPIGSSLSDTWEVLIPVFEAYFSWFERARLGLGFRGWEEYSEHILRAGSGMTWQLYARELFSVIRTSTTNGQYHRILNVSRYAPRNTSLATVPLLLFSLDGRLRVKNNLHLEAARILGANFDCEMTEEWCETVGCYLRLFYAGPFVEMVLSGEK